MILKRIFEVIEKAKDKDIASKIFDISIIVLIMLNIIAVILESFYELQLKYFVIFQIFEIISIIIFSVEYTLRLITSKYKYQNNNFITALIKNFFSFMLIIDLMAILPFYLPLIIIVDLRFLRILRMTRILRVFKMNRYTKALIMIKNVFKKKKEELFITLFISFLILILSSSIIYYVETDIQPSEFPNIIASFWWGISTLTTVGYGDVFPVTVLGKLLSGVIAFIGIGLVALPTGIISSGFIEEMQNKKKKNKYCPNCGEKIE